MASGDGRRLRCAFVGDEALVVQCIQIAEAHGLEPVLVATASPIVRDFGRQQGIPAVGPGAELAAGLDEHPADVLFSIANLRLISDDVLARVSTAINYHDGPLPGYAGLNVTTWAILGGEDAHAITWHLMTSDVDGGEVVATEDFAITDDETAFSLNARCYEAALASFPRIAAALAAGDLVTTPQPTGEHRMFRRHDRPARVLDPADPAATSARDVRALDLGGRIANTVGAVRWMLGRDAYVVDAATVTGDPDPSAGTPGTIVVLGAGGVCLATSDGQLLVSRLSTPEGEAVDIADVVRAHGFAVGDVVPVPDPALVAAVGELEPKLAVDEVHWLDQLAANDPVTPAGAGALGGARQTRTVELPADADSATVLATVALWLSRATGAETVGFSLTDAASRERLERLAPLARPALVAVPVVAAAPFSDLRASVQAELASRSGRFALLRDAIGRDPRTRGRVSDSPVLVELDVDPSAAGANAAPWAERSVLRLAITEDALFVDGVIDPADPQALDRVADQLSTLVASATQDPGSRCDALALLGAAETALLDAVNRTDLDHDRTATIDSLFRAQVDRTPDAPALSFGPVTLTYRELHDRTQVLAGRLTAAGVGRGDRVGIATERGVEMLVGVLATLEVGASYVPLDPTYPSERLTLMAEDAGIVAMLAASDVAERLCPPGVTAIDPTAPGDGSGVAPAPAHDAADLAYVIYTSGSTGRPKGVMLEHREVTNFFAAMDEVIDHDPPGVWLAVTSLSFDISVLELLWTLTRGFHVVLKADRGIPVAGAAAPAGPVRPVSFSLFYFAAGEQAASDGYRLLLESARFADRNGFEAVWTPERHFHAFGGAYPNPSVTGAALAAITEHVGIRAGSVVLPLHSPVRVAEEWAVVDNISRGRVAISFAAGWQPNDFVLNPSAYANSKENLPRDIDTVRRLWRGETIALPGHDGEPVDVSTLPRPVQAELPVWMTSAGTPATFERAGKLGMNVLTHLLGQSVEQLSENIALYRAAWGAAGHEGEGRVTLMMHTYLDADADTAREVAREPMKGYLGTAVGLLRDVASTFPTFANRGSGTDDLFKSLTPDELDQLLEVAAQRYLSTSGLFGTADDVAAIVETVSAAGADEVACLVDFGIDTDEVLESLDLLLAAKQLVDARRVDAADAVTEAAGAQPGMIESAGPRDDSVAALAEHHGVTHLQCTPSLAAMLAADPADRDALTSIRHLMLGGEALPAALAAELRALLPGRFTNMYGPTETTIWSLTHELTDPIEAAIPIGRPIANTTIFVLDAAGHRLPLGTFGELHIGGEGVARGYHGRPDLTAERFVDRPGMGRVYATGDIVRIPAQGPVEFAGRADNQVKIRGHRIELGEIESVLDRHPAVAQSVVVADDGNGDTRLVAYVVLGDGAEVTSSALRDHVGDALPAAMVPSAVMRLDAFPLTPNGKVDRKALPAVDGEAGMVRAAEVTAPPADDTEKLVADIWADELGFAVGRDDNFFDIGGHSLLAVKVFRRLSDETGAPLALTDVFRFPTVRTIAAHIGELQGTSSTEQAAQAVGGPTGGDRGALRRRARGRRGRVEQGESR